MCLSVCCLGLCQGTEPFDPLMTDPLFSMVNSPVNASIDVDCRLVDPDGRPVHRAKYRLEYEVPGKYEEDVSEQALTPRDGAIRHNQPGAVRVELAVEKDGYYTIKFPMKGGVWDENTRTRTYRQDVVLQPHDPTLPELIIGSDEPLHTALLPDGLRETWPRRELKMAPMEEGEYNGRVWLAGPPPEFKLHFGRLDTLEEELNPVVLLTLEPDETVVGYRSWEPWGTNAQRNTLEEENGFAVPVHEGMQAGPDGKRVVLRMVSSDPDDGFVPDFLVNPDWAPDRWLTGRPHADGNWDGPPTVSITKERGVDRDAQIKLMTEAPETGYVKELKLPAILIGSHSYMFLYLRIGGKYGKACLIEPQAYTIVGDYLEYNNPANLAAGFVVWINPTGSRDLRMAPDYGVSFY